LKFVIPDIPKSNNEYIGRKNIYQYQSDKKHWCDMLWAYCRPKPPKPFEKAIVVITYHFTDKIRRDPDNYSGKMILDGLVRNGILKDDSFFCIRLILDAEFGCDNKETVIEVIEKEGF
jgi:Holliday junction resolvase RusA-like endonuclease